MTSGIELKSGLSNRVRYSSSISQLVISFETNKKNWIALVIASQCESFGAELIAYSSNHLFRQEFAKFKLERKIIVSFGPAIVW